MATLSAVLGQIRQHESAGNYNLTPQQNYDYPRSHASGAYQFQPTTWQSLTQQSGIGTQYSEAYLAPANVQDAVAAYGLTQAGGNANVSSLWKANDVTYPQVDNYDVTPQQLASSTGGLQIAQGPPDTSSGLNAGTGASGSTEPLYYQGYDDNGNFVGATTDSTQYPVSGATHYSPVYAGAAGAGTSTTTSGTGTSTTTSGTQVGLGAGADIGYTPPASTGGPQTTGLAPGVVTSVGGWIGNIETAVGNAFRGFGSGLLGGIENWVARFFVIIVGVVILAIALWRLIDPSGDRTREVMRGAMAAA